MYGSSYADRGEAMRVTALAIVGEGGEGLAEHPETTVILRKVSERAGDGK